MENLENEQENIDNKQEEESSQVSYYSRPPQPPSSSVNDYRSTTTDQQSQQDSQQQQQLSSRKSNSSLQRRNSNFFQKNLDMIEQKKQKLQKQKEEQEQQEKKKQELREKLQKKILAEAAKRREEKQNQNPEEKSVELPPLSNQKSSKGRRNKKDIIEQFKEGLVKKEDLDEDQLKQVLEYEKKVEQENIEKQKKKKYFRSRYASFLENLKSEKEKKQKDQEDQEKKKQEFISANKQNFNVTSKLYEQTKSSQYKDITTTNQKRNRSVSSEVVNEEERQQEIKEAQKKLLEKQKQHLNKIKDKNQSKKEEKEEEKKKKEELKSKMRDYVLVQVKKDIENGDFYIEDPQEIKKQKKKEKLNKKLEALDLETQNQGVKKISAQKPPLNKTTPIQKEDSEQQDEGGPEEEGEKKKKKKLRSYPFITDFDQWKKKQRLPPDQKIFIVNGGYPAIKKALRARGWLENPDHHSSCFDLKWTLQGRDLDYNNLQDFQIVNHFEKNNCITTKVGLCKNLKNLIWFSNIDIDCFFPRCFDLNDPEDYLNFVEDFKTTKAEGILKSYMRMYYNQDKDIESFIPITQTALKVCQRKIRDLNDIIDDKSKNPLCLITDKEWEILSKDELDSESLAVKKHQAWLQKLGNKGGPKKKKKKKKKKVQKKVEEQEEEKKNNSEEDEDEEEDDDEDAKIKKMDPFTREVYDILEIYKQQYPQYPLNGENNIWIIKPAGLSRGRGITCYNNLIEIEDHVKSKEMQWVIQKYMENPMIIMSRKFDIRVWVLVTDFNPLTIWLYEEVYLRFSAIDYNVEAKELSNKFLHLTNNSVSAKHKGCDKIVGTGNMWSQAEFQQHLIDLEGEDLFTNKIMPGIKTAVKNSIECIQDQLETRKNSCELFGYDFMVDDKYNPWLIECNSSPTMEYSTELTERMVKEQLDSLVKVIVDYNSARKKKGIDTGLWKRIHKGSSYAEKNLNNLGLNLCLEGVAIKKKPQNLPKINNIQFKK